MELTITTVNPLDHAEEIKRLFVTNGRAEFPQFFDRAYEVAVRAGGMSWLGRDRAGEIVMHVACFPRRVNFVPRAVPRALVVNSPGGGARPVVFPARPLTRGGARGG